uniref:Uncharacterized protein n=1 Tax=Siphoviridae sp. ctRNB7 TaxID=2825502 RepID=A0A8S5PVJ4_9CAUD|nr:MAG TPA: hypothetical protein [Siphoviridae sp. ctRNB7]
MLAVSRMSYTTNEEPLPIISAVLFLKSGNLKKITITHGTLF